MNPLAHRRPSKGTLTGRVWEIADEITRRTGRTASRKDVVRRFVEEDGNPNTASTQYQHWKAYRDAAVERRGAATPLPGGGAPASAPGAEATTWQLRIGPDGRLLVPLALRKAMMLGGDGHVTVRIVDGELRAIAPAAQLAHTRRALADRVPEGISLVDELIAERRREARREDQTDDGDERGDDR